MKPIRNWVLLCNGVEVGYVEFDEVVPEGDARREASNRVARFLMLTRRGKSLED
jgi:hypothetical protein